MDPTYAARKLRVQKNNKKFFNFFKNIIANKGNKSFENN